MLILIAIINNILNPVWDTYKKYLGKQNLASLSIICSPNLIEHTLGIIILSSLGIFILPQDSHFYLYWFIMILISAVELTLNIWGLVESSFFGVRIIGSLSFVVSSIAAVFFIGEQLQISQYIAIIVAIFGIVLFTWPKGKILNLKTLDRGIIFVFISVILSGISLIPYKMATFYTPDYPTFLTGRIVGDLIGWNLVWIGSLIWLKRSPVSEIKKLISKKEAFFLMIGASGANLISSWLIYKMPVTDLSILGTLGIITAYFIDSYHYKNRLTTRMWIGSICIIISIGIFFWNK